MWQNTSKLPFQIIENFVAKYAGPQNYTVSRPEEEILEQLGDTARIEFGSDPLRDVIILVKTVERQLSYLSTDVKARVIETLSHLAQTSAIWTQMIVELIEITRLGHSI